MKGEVSSQAQEPSKTLFVEVAEALMVGWSDVLMCIRDKEGKVHLEFATRRP